MTVLCKVFKGRKCVEHSGSINKPLKHLRSLPLFSQVVGRVRQGYAFDDKTFLFSFVNSMGKTLTFVNKGPNISGMYSIYDYNNVCMTYGGGYDLHIASQAHLNTASYTSLGQS